MARHGKLALYRSFGDATVDPSRPADERTLFPLFSNTKVITAAAVWTLVEEGKLRFSDRIAEHVPGFEAHGKNDVTLAHLLTHQAGFPAAEVAPECFMDRERLRRAVCDFKLDWPPGSRSIYHRTAAHWVVGVLIEAITGTDYREEIRKRVIEPLGLTREMFLGLPDTEDRIGQPRCTLRSRQTNFRSIRWCRPASGARESREQEVTQPRARWPSSTR